MRSFLRSFSIKVRHNFWLKLLSLALAFVVWVIVVAYYNPETTNLIEDIPITVDYETSVLEEQGLILVTAPEGTVDVKIEGRREKLALVSKDKVTAMISLASVTKPGEYDLPVNIVVDGQSITTVSQSVETMTLKFEKAVKAQFTVDVITKGEVADGYVLEKTANPTVVTVTGPESTISAIAAVQAVVTQDKFIESAVYDATMIYLDKNGEKLDDTYLSMDSDTVKVNISLHAEKEIPVQIDLTNSAGGNDSAYMKVSVVPETITVVGSADALANINSISLGSIDVSEIDGDYTAEMPLILPNGVKSANEIEKAKVTVSFEGIVTKQFKIHSSRIQFENVAKGNKISVPESTLTITVRGDAADINKLKDSAISLKIDCKNQTLSKGSNLLKAYCVFPETYKVGAYGKIEVTAKVS